MTQLNYAARVERMRGEWRSLLASWQASGLVKSAHEIAIFLEEETRGAERRRR